MPQTRTVYGGKIDIVLKKNWKQKSFWPRQNISPEVWKKIDDILLRLFNVMYKQVKVGDSNFSAIIAGVLQGRTVAPYLLVISLDYIPRTSINLMLYSHIHIHNACRNIVNNNDDFNERTNTILYKNIPLTLYSGKGWYWLCVRGELETGTDCYILTPSSSDHSSTSFAFWLGCSTVGHWEPKPSVWSWFSLRWHLISNWNCNWTDPSRLWHLVI